MNTKPRVNSLTEDESDNLDCMLYKAHSDIEEYNNSKKEIETNMPNVRCTSTPTNYLKSTELKIANSIFAEALKTIHNYGHDQYGLANNDEELINLIHQLNLTETIIRNIGIQAADLLKQNLNIELTSFTLNKCILSHEITGSIHYHDSECLLNLTINWAIHGVNAGEAIIGIIIAQGNTNNSITSGPRKYFFCSATKPSDILLQAWEFAKNSIEKLKI